MEITQKHLDLVASKKPCKMEYQAGQKIEDVSFSDLSWVESVLPKEAVRVAKAISEKNKRTIGVPFLAAFSSGDGDGSGSGYGDGDGYGYGYGDGYGDGYGSGYGYGDGTAEL